MIEECDNILECENKLSSITQKVSLLGEFPLSSEEVDKLGAFIKEQTSENIQRGTEFLKTKTPICLACFLVWKGILDYKDGDYWSVIKDPIGLPDLNWQVKWGGIFIDFLESNGLPSFDIKDALRYVTPILIHGMIPNSCLDEYFEKILVPMVKCELADSTDRKEISFLLGNRREDNKERKAIEKEVKKSQIQKSQISNKLSRDRSLIKIWDDLDKIKALEQEEGNPDELTFLPEDPLECKSKKNLAIQNLQKDIEELQKKERQREQQRKKFLEIDKEVLANSDAIIQCINILPGLEQELRVVTELKAREYLLKEQMEKRAESIFSERWDERYAPLICELPFDELQVKIEAFDSRKISESDIKQGYFKNILRIIKGWTNYFFSFFRKQGRKTDKGLYVEIQEILRELPIDEVKIEHLQTKLVQSLRLLKDTYENVCQLSESRESLEEENRERISKIKNVAEAVGVDVVDITDNIRHVVTAMQNKLAEAQRNRQSTNQAEQEIKNIENNITELEVKKLSLIEELQEINGRLVKLGKGDIKLGIERLEQRRDTQLKTELLRNDLMKVYPDLKSLEQEKDEAQKDGKDKSCYNLEINSLGVEIEQIKQRITELEERLNHISVPFPYVDEPIRRFLLYAGDTARDFLVQSVQMVNQTIEEQKVPSVDKIGLPERVVTKFGEWWKEHEKIEEEEINDVRPVQKSQERFRSPVILLDTAIGEIKVQFPPQRFSIPYDIAKIWILMNEAKPSLYKEQLKVYKYNKKLFVTEKIDFHVPSPSDCYEFCLRIGNEISKFWNVSGISREKPFIAFDYDSNKLIQGAELPQGRVWVVFHNRFILKPTQVITEKAPLYGKWREYKYLALDLSDVEQLDLVDEQGEKKSIPISQEKVFEPILYGGQVLRGCHSVEEDIYVGEPPSIRIPIESDAEIKGWIISILKDSDSTLTESKYYRLSDLEKISNIDRNEGVFKIPLSNEKCVGESPVGRFIVRLKNDGRHIDKWFSFCVLPHLKVEFDKDIYLPYEADPSQIYLRLGVLEQTEFEPRSPARIIDHKDSSYGIETNAIEDAIHGILRYLFNDYLISMPITVKIPRLTWRLDGLPNNEYSSESNRVEEIWFGDWKNADESLSLIVNMPSFIHGQGQLSLHNLEQKLEAKIAEGKARFDLLRFSDTLRTDDQPLQSFQLTVFGSETSIEKVELFKVRTRWEVEEIKCIQSFSEGKINLQISWRKEHGKAEAQRIVRLWRIWEPDSAPVTRQVPEGAYRIEISEEGVNLPPGSYRLHIDVEDPWSTTPASPPALNSPNTSVIEIAPTEVQTPPWIGFGRKKAAIAEAVLKEGIGEIKVNGQPLRDYFAVTLHKARGFLLRLLKLNQVHKILSKVDVLITVEGSSPHTMRQAKAVAHALARALMVYDPEIRSLLKCHGFGGVKVSIHHKRRLVCRKYFSD
jgi:ribosomal protein S9